MSYGNSSKFFSKTMFKPLASLPLDFSVFYCKSFSKHMHLSHKSESCITAFWYSGSKMTSVSLAVKENP